MAAVALCGCVGDLGADPLEALPAAPTPAEPGEGEGETERPSAVRVALPERENPEVWEPVDTDWCAADGWLGLDAQTCFYLPSAPTGRVVVYLHGMMPPDASARIQQLIVAEAAEATGAVAIFPQGTPGLCAWDASVIDWLCWPTSRANVDAFGATLVGGFDEAVTLLEEVFSLSLDQRHVFGFSNGGYFASYIGLEDLWRTEGAGLVGAGRSAVDPATLAAHRPPIYIAVGELETATVKNSAQNLAYVLSLEGWVHDLVVHPARGHEVRADDLVAAFSLWSER